MISTVAFMASFASCNKMEQGNTPAEAPSIDGTTTITVSATVPQTKTYLNGGNTFWTKGDIVTLMGRYEASVVETATASAEATQGTNNFTFEKWPVAATPEFLVFDGPLAYDEENYGGNKVMAPVLNEDGTITAEVRKHQEIVNRSNFSKYANLSIGKLEGESSLYTAEMKNVCGLIKVRTTKEDPLEYIKIENLGESYITGVVKVDYNNGEPRVVEVLNGSKEVKLTSHISDTNDKLPASTYYACVLPGTYTPKVIMKPVDGGEVALTAKSPVTIERNKIMDFGEIDNLNPEQPGTGEGGDEPVTPPSPTKTLTLTVDFSAWPFQEAVVNSKTTTAAEGNEYTFVHDGENYKFTIINTVIDGSCKGFYWRSATQGIQGNDSIKTGVTGDFEVKFPVVKDMKLTSVAVSVANAETNKKFVKILNAGGGTVVSDNVHNQNSPKVFEIPEPVVSSSYSLTSGGKNIQLLGLILTYTN